MKSALLLMLPDFVSVVMELAHPVVTWCVRSLHLKNNGVKMGFAGTSWAAVT
jgi:hypothetical protein